MIVDQNNRIVSTGYNGPPAGFVHFSNECRSWCPRSQYRCSCGHARQDHTGAHESPTACDVCGCWGYDGDNAISSNYDDCVSLHAEANALIVCDRSQHKNGTIYVTSHICSTCAKLIANSGLTRVVIAPSAPHEHRNSTPWVTFMKNCGLDVDYVS